MTLSPIEAITSSRPPVSDPLTYLTIIEAHLSPEILPALQNILQDDAELTQSIGWDLVQQLLPLPGADACLQTIARLGNPREVILKVTEALQLLNLDEEQDHDLSDHPANPSDAADAADAAHPKEPDATDKFCCLVRLLSILHPRIKTKYPSRFLSTSLVAILSAYRPTTEATLAVTTFVHKLSGAKRPTIPRRESSSNRLALLVDDRKLAPDPEAQDEEPDEAAVQQKLLQSFTTHILEVYISRNELEWAARLSEHLEPEKVVKNRQTITQKYKEEPEQQDRDLIVGRLVALTRDLGLVGHEFLLEAIDAASATPPDEEDDLPNKPEDVPLSPTGSLFVVTSSVISSILFDSRVDVPPFTIFPDHQKLVQHFIGTTGPESIGSENPAVLDAILALGIWLEHSNKFVAGPLEDEDFLQQLQTLSLISANCPSPTLRYAAHTLTASILHAHPLDRVRLTFICDTLEHCPYENLKASAVAWLKEEIMNPKGRTPDTVFTSTVALVACMPFLFPDLTKLSKLSDEETWEELKLQFPFIMAILNFLVFTKGDNYDRVVPPNMLSVVDAIFLRPLKETQKRLEEDLGSEGKLSQSLGDEAAQALTEVRLMGERLDTCGN